VAVSGKLAFKLRVVVFLIPSCSFSF